MPSQRSLDLNLFKRIINVEIGNGEGTALSIGTSERNSTFIQMEIMKNISSKVNEGVVRMFNLSDSTENQIREKGKRVRVFAGHNGNPILIHDGEITRVDRDPDENSLNRITSVSLAGKLIKISQSIFNKAYSGQVAVKQIVIDAIPTFGLEYINIDQIPDNEFLNDYSFTGKTSDLLDEILDPIKIQWFENDNFIKFSAREKTPETTQAVVLLNSNTGLIGSPSITEKGAKFTSVLNGRITLNSQIKIESNLVNGVYKVIQTLNSGDNRDGKFTTEGIVTNIEQS